MKMYQVETKLLDKDLHEILPIMNEGAFVTFYVNAETESEAEEIARKCIRYTGKNKCASGIGAIEQDGTYRFIEDVIDMAHDISTRQNTKG